MDKIFNTLRQKILAKFTLKVLFVPSKNNKVNAKLSLASIEKIPPLFPPNHRRRSTKSPNISRRSNQPMYLNNLKNHMPRFRNKMPILLRLSRSKRLSHLLVQTKSTRLIILSRTTLR